MPKPENPGNGGGNDGGGDAIVFAISGLDDASDTGISQTDDLTKYDTDFTITGTLDSSISYIDFRVRLTLSDGTELVFSVNETNPAVIFSFDGAGNWSFTYNGPELLDGSVQVDAEYDTLHKNGKTVQTTSAGSYAFEIDSTIVAPQITEVTPVGDDLDITGTAEAGATITIYRDNNMIGTTTADSNGDWTYTDLNSSGSSVVYTASAADAAGNTAQTAEGFSYSPGTDNTAASISGETAGDVTEDALFQASGTLTVTDPDPNEDALQSTSGGVYGTFTVNSDGTWTYVLDNENLSVQALGEGDTLDDSITVISVDGTASETITVTINGTNDEPTITGTTTGDVSEDGTLQASGSLMVSDVDDGESALQAVTAGAGSYGTFDVDANGNWTYSLDNGSSTVQALGEGETLTDTFTVTSADGSATKPLTVTITGTNDIPIITGDTTGSLTEDDAANDTATGHLVATDPDSGESGVQAQPDTAGTYGSFSITSTGSWAYSIDNTVAAVQALAAGETATDSFVVWSADGSASETVTITVTGVNDLASISGDASGSVTEDATTTTAQGTLTVDDPDTGESAATAVAAGTASTENYGTYEVQADGTWIYTLDNSHADVQALAAGEALTDTFTVSSLDGTASQTVTITINGADEPEPAPSGGSVNTADEPLYTQQWHLGYVGDIETIWQEFSGWDVSVGVYDNGIDYTHPDLFDNYDASKHVIVNGEVLDPAPSETVSAEHGTAVSGIIAAVDNDEGGLGVAPNASLTGVNIFGGPADINGTDVSGFSEAVNQAYTFDVVNNSWGTVPNFNHENDPAMLAALAGFETAALTGRGGLGTIVVKAAGNDYDSSQEFLNASRYTVTVAAHDEDGDASWYTNRGANLLVSAPSSGSSADADSGILTTDEQGSEGYAAGNYTYGFGGTSSAAPVVSGVVAMMLDANPKLGARDVQTILAYSAHILGVDSPETAKVPADSDGDGTADTTVDFPVEFFDWFRTGADNWNGGGLHFSEDYGFGGVNAYNAVRMAEVWTLFGDPQTFGTAQQGGNELTHARAPQTPGLAYDNQWVEVTYSYDGPPMDLEYIEVYVDFKAGGGMLDLYGNMEDTSIELVSPSGTAVSLMQGSDGYDSTNNYLNPFPDMDSGGQVTWTYGVNAFRGEDITGEWTLRIVDIGDDLYDGGVLNEFQITFYGAAPDDNDVYHYTDEIFAELALELALDPPDPSRKYLSDSGGTDDWLNMAAMTEDLAVDLATGTASGAIGGTIIEDGAQDIENVVTGDGNDHLTGSAADNELHGMRGNDTLDGGLGNDILWGGLGDDLFVFYPGDGADWLGDFTAGASTDDVVALYGFGELTFDTLNFTDIEGGGTLLDLGDGDTITFAGLSWIDLHQDDFDFLTLA